MKRTIDSLKEEFTAIRSGRPSVAILDKLQVTYQDAKYPLVQLGQVSLRDPQTLQITVYDPQFVKSVRDAIAKSELGLQPVLEGELIKVPLPKVTQEFRQSLVKQIGQLAEQSKIRLRNQRKDAMDAIKKVAKSLSKDDVKRYEKEIQELTDKYTKTITDLHNSKEKDILNF